MPRKTVETYPPLFPGRFPVWHQFWASPTDQGVDCAWMRWRLLALSRNSRTIFSQKIAIGTDPRSGLVMGDSGHYGPTSFRPRKQQAHPMLIRTRKEGRPGVFPRKNPTWMPET